MTVLPGYAEGYGNDVLRAHSQFTEADILMTLMDVWVLKPDVMKTLPWAAWMPVDHDPPPLPVIKAIKEGEGVPIAMSKFGQERLLAEGLDALYVPHAPDHEFFDETDRDEARKARKWDDKFVFGMVAANKGWPCRKAFPEVFQAFKQIQDEYDDVHLHLHTKKDAPWGVDLVSMMEQMGIDLSADKVSFVDQYQYVVGMGTPYMRDTYAAMDVLVNPAYGEGFGIPIVEAQACGTPVIVNNFTAMPELVFSGTIVDGEPWYTAQDSWQKKPFITDIYDAMKHWYGQTYDYTEAKVLQNTVKGQYHPDVVLEKYWKPTLEECLVRLEGRKVLPEGTPETEDDN
jgi:glycosyltransferase involved in cell wall biosynthesis